MDWLANTSGSSVNSSDSTESCWATWANMRERWENNWVKLRQLVTSGTDSYSDLDYQGFRVVVNKQNMLAISPMRLMRPTVRSMHLLVSYHCSMLQNGRKSYQILQIT